ncbi:hypothetical protein Hdeb2414_s0016g00469971 [Helianthus debilis subsp. tardiflorus]
MFFFFLCCYTECKCWYHTYYVTIRTDTARIPPQRVGYLSWIHHKSQLYVTKDTCVYDSGVLCNCSSRGKTC